MPPPGADEAEAAASALSRIAELSLLGETLAAHLPPTWRKSRFRIKGLQKAAQYNDLEGIVKGDNEDGTRLKVQIQNEERTELGVRRANLVLVDDKIDPETEPQLVNGLQRLKMARSAEVPRTRQGVEAAAVNWTHGLMDVTFGLESRLVDCDFGKDELFRELLGQMRGVQDFCVELSREWGDKTEDAAAPASTHVPAGTAAMVRWLGEGLAECVHWRMGALLYMFVATLVQVPRQVLVGDVHEALTQLELMLLARGQRMALGMEEAEGDDVMREMIKARILSDTHLLSVVYAGEICVWGMQQDSVKTEGEKCKVSSALATAFAPEEVPEALTQEALRRLGIIKLKLYLRIVEVMAKSTDSSSVGAGWDTTRAEDLLGQLQKL